MTRFGFCKKCLVVAAGGLSLWAGKATAASVVSKSQAAEIAQQEFGGKLFGKIKKIESASGDVIYEIRLDDNGRVMIVRVSGKGQILGKK